MDSTRLPALRHVDAFPVQHEGREYICLRDPEGFFENLVLLSPHAFFIAACLNGSRNVDDILAAFRAQFSGMVPSADEVVKIVSFLDDQGALDTAKFQLLKRSVIKSFTRSGIRPAYLAGKSYPTQPEEVRTFLNEFYAQNDGVPADPSGKSPFSRPKCLIAPHIDYGRGGHSYAKAYGRLGSHAMPETVLVFGVAHADPETPFVLTRKDFATPLGVLKTNLDIVAELESACSWNPYADEIVHRTEHSIEFQAVMLTHRYGTGCSIIPVLCSSFPVPSEPEERFLAACRRIVQGTPSITIVAGADLAHVGRRFGDDVQISEEIVRDVEKRDREDLEHVLSASAGSFYDSVMKDENRRRVCGLYCIYAALKCIEGTSRGELLHYDYAHDPAGGIVSFASVIFD